MPKQLIIARHAHAADGKPGQPDKERNLTADGLVEAGNSANWLKNTLINVPVIIVSPAKRTQQTAEIYTTNLTGSESEFLTENFLYAATASDIIDFITDSFDQEKAIMIVGHNPAVSVLAETLSNGNIKYLAPAGIIVFQTDLNSWQDLRLQPLLVVAQNMHLSD